MDEHAESRRHSRADREVAGTKPENVYVHNCLLGGGFGRRSPADFASEAVKIAKTLDVPVKMIWSRDEDTRMGRYRPMSHMRFDAALDHSGKPTAYVSHSVTPSILATAGRLAPNAVDMTSVDGLAQIPYNIANQRITNLRRETHLTSGSGARSGRHRMSSRSNRSSMSLRWRQRPIRSITGRRC